MRFHNFALRSLGFRGTHFKGVPGFGSLPADPHQWTKYGYNGGQNPGETDALFNNDDGLNGGGPTSFQWVETGGRETFSSVYARAQAISDQIDAVRDDPFAAALVQKEAALSQQITSGLLDARSGYPWGSPFGRPASQQQILWTAYGKIYDGLIKYQNLQGAVDDVKAQIAARQTTSNAVVVQANLTTIAMSAKMAKAAQADTAVLESNRATGSAIAAQAEAQETLARQQSDQIISAATQPKIFGLPLGTVLPIAGAGVIALLLLHRPVAVRPVAGYRRRRRG